MTYPSSHSTEPGLELRPRVSKLETFPRLKLILGLGQRTPSPQCCQLPKDLGRVGNPTYSALGPRVLHSLTFCSVMFHGLNGLQLEVLWLYIPGPILGARRDLDLRDLQNRSQWTLYFFESLMGPLEEILAHRNGDRKRKRREITCQRWRHQNLPYLQRREKLKDPISLGNEL